MPTAYISFHYVLDFLKFTLPQNMVSFNVSENTSNLEIAFHLYKFLDRNSDKEFFENSQIGEKIDSIQKACRKEIKQQLQNALRPSTILAVTEDGSFNFQFKKIIDGFGKDAHFLTIDFSIQNYRDVQIIRWPFECITIPHQEQMQAFFAFKLGDINKKFYELEINKENLQKLFQSWLKDLSKNIQLHFRSFHKPHPSKPLEQLIKGTNFEFEDEPCKQCFQRRDQQERNEIEEKNTPQIASALQAAASKTESQEITIEFNFYFAKFYKACSFTKTFSISKEEQQIDKLIALNKLKDALDCVYQEHIYDFLQTAEEKIKEKYRQKIAKSRKKDKQREVPFHKMLDKLKLKDEKMAIDILFRTPGIQKQKYCLSWRVLYEKLFQYHNLELRQKTISDLNLACNNLRELYENYLNGGFVDYIKEFLPYKNNGHEKRELDFSCAEETSGEFWEEQEKNQNDLSSSMSKLSLDYKKISPNAKIEIEFYSIIESDLFLKKTEIAYFYPIDDIEAFGLQFAKVLSFVNIKIQVRKKIQDIRQNFINALADSDKGDQRRGNSNFGEVIKFFQSEKFPAIGVSLFAKKFAHEDWQQFVCFSPDATNPDCNDQMNNKMQTSWMNIFLNQENKLFNLHINHFGNWLEIYQYLINEIAANIQQHWDVQHCLNLSCQNCFCIEQALPAPPTPEELQVTLNEDISTKKEISKSSKEEIDTTQSKSNNGEIISTPEDLKNGAKRISDLINYTEKINADSDLRALSAEKIECAKENSTKGKLMVNLPSELDQSPRELAVALSKNPPTIELKDNNQQKDKRQTIEETLHLHGLHNTHRVKKQQFIAPDPKDNLQSARSVSPPTTITHKSPPPTPPLSSCNQPPTSTLRKDVNITGIAKEICGEKYRSSAPTSSCVESEKNSTNTLKLQHTPKVNKHRLVSDQKEMLDGPVNLLSLANSENQDQKPPKKKNKKKKKVNSLPTEQQNTYTKPQMVKAKDADTQQPYIGEKQQTCEKNPSSSTTENKISTKPPKIRHSALLTFYHLNNTELCLEKEIFFDISEKATELQTIYCLSKSLEYYLDDFGNAKNKIFHQMIEKLTKKDKKLTFQQLFDKYTLDDEEFFLIEFFIYHDKIRKEFNFPMLSNYRTGEQREWQFIYYCDYLQKTNFIDLQAGNWISWSIIYSTLIKDAINRINLGYVEYEYLLQIRDIQQQSQSPPLTYLQEAKLVSTKTTEVVLSQNGQELLIPITIEEMDWETNPANTRNDLSKNTQDKIKEISSDIECSEHEDSQQSANNNEGYLSDFEIQPLFSEKSSTQEV